MGGIFRPRLPPEAVFDGLGPVAPMMQDYVDMMSPMTINRTLWITGAVLASNGMMLVVAPARYATLQDRDWLPSQLHAALRWAADSPSASRLIGATAALTGAALLAGALMRTDPAT